MKQLTEKIYAVEVPKDGKKFKVYLAGRPDSPYGNNQFANGSYTELWWTEKGKHSTCVIDQSGSYKILGVVTPDSIGFDVTQDHVEMTEIDIEQCDGIFVATPRLYDYDDESFSLTDYDESFRTLLSKHSIAPNENNNVLIIERV